MGLVAGGGAAFYDAKHSWLLNGVLATLHLLRLVEMTVNGWTPLNPRFSPFRANLMMLLMHVVALIVGGKDWAPSFLQQRGRPAACTTSTSRKQD